MRHPLNQPPVVSTADAGYASVVLSLSGAYVGALLVQVAFRSAYIPGEQQTLRPDH